MFSTYIVEADWTRMVVCLYVVDNIYMVDCLHIHIWLTACIRICHMGETACTVNCLMVHVMDYCTMDCPCDGLPA